MRKLSLVFTLVICITFFSGITVQASETVFHVDNQSGEAGEQVSVPVEFTSGEEVGGFQISVYYDPELLEFQSLERGDLVVEEGGIFDYNHIADSAEIIIVYVVADTVKAQGVVADITFTLKADCQEQLPIGMSVDDLVDSSEESNSISGEVTGVDEAFQTRVMQARESSQASDRQQDAATDAGSEEERTDDGSAEAPTEEPADDTSTEEGEQSRQESEEGKKEESNMATVALVAAVVVLIAAAAVVLIKKKKSGKEI